jgi:hypothetical protein
VAAASQQPRGPGGEASSSQGADLGRGGDGWDLLAAGLLAALAWLCYSAVTRLWWTNDDFFHLHFILIHPPFSYFYDPAVCRQLPVRMITPLLFGSLQLDLSTFGLAPRGFYLHQLLVVSLAVAAFYLLLRLWLPRWLSLAGGFLLLVGPPMTASVGLLMVRHYLEGALLATVSAGLFVRALRGGRSAGGAQRSASASASVSARYARVSALFYLLAALEKEIFVPLVLVLLAVPEGRWRERLRCAWPHLAVLSCYIAYRLLLLGMLAGGYGWVVTPRDLLRLAAELPGKILADLGGGETLGGIALAVLGAGALAGVVLRPRTIPVTVIGLLSAVLPVLPVSTHLHVRYTLASWAAAVLAGLSGWQALAARGRQAAGFAAAVVAVACSAAGFSAHSAWAKSLGELERMSAEGRCFVAMPAGSLLRQPLGPGSSFNELRWFKEQRFGLAKGTSWSYDDLALCTRPVPGLRVWSYDDGRRRMAEVTADLPRLCRQYFSTVRPLAPLSASFEPAGGQLVWHLGPYAAGDYAFLLGDGAVLLPVARDAGFQTRGMQSVSLRVRYQSPAGWLTYSPAFDLDLSRPSPLRWQRGG